MILIAYFMLCIPMIKSHGSFFKDDIQSYVSDDGFEGENLFFSFPLILFTYLEDSSVPTEELEVNSLDGGIFN